MDVNRILQIPLNNQSFSDFIAWSGTSHGRYSVRSGYHMQWRHQFGSRADQLALPGSSANNPVWKILWKLKIPSKVKIFIWRALHGITPLKCILINRHIGTSGECPICHQGAEDVCHLLFVCPTARDLWTSLGLLEVIDESGQEDRFGSVILEILLRNHDNTIEGLEGIGLKETISIACWYLWWLRRRRTNNESVPMINYCKISILTMVANHAKASTAPTVNPETKWSRPSPRQVKLNVDASFHAEVCAGATGAILRDYRGQFIAASSNYLPSIASVAMAEAVAMKEGLILATRMGCNTVIAESDSMEIIEGRAKRRSTYPTRG